MTSDSPLLFQFGDVVLVRFPYTNQAAAKQRPAVVVSNSEYSQVRPDVITLAITSQLYGTLSTGDMPIADWRMCGLLKPSAIKPVFATVEQGLVVRRLGTLHQPDASALRTFIATIIG